MSEKRQRDGKETRGTPVLSGSYNTYAECLALLGPELLSDAELSKAAGPAVRFPRPMATWYLAPDIGNSFLLSYSR